MPARSSETESRNFKSAFNSDGVASNCGAGSEEVFGDEDGNGEGDGNELTYSVLARVDQTLQCLALNFVVRARQP